MSNLLIINKIKSILEEELETQKAVKKCSNCSKRRRPLQKLHEMKAYLNKCIDVLHYAVYTPIWMPDEQKWAIGECGKDWGDSNHTASILCPEYVHAEAEYQAASGPEKSALKDKRDAKFARCDKNRKGRWSDVSYVL